MKVMEGMELGRLLLVPRPLRPMEAIEDMELERLLLRLLLHLRQEIMWLLAMIPLRNLHKLKLVPRALMKVMEGIELGRPPPLVRQSLRQEVMEGMEGMEGM